MIKVVKKMGVVNNVTFQSYDIYHVSIPVDDPTLETKSDDPDIVDARQLIIMLDRIARRNELS